MSGYSGIEPKTWEIHLSLKIMAASWLYALILPFGVILVEVIEPGNGFKSGSRPINIRQEGPG